VKLYLDSSALVKLVTREAESSALRSFLRRHRADGRVTSALARVEVVRAVTAGGPDAVAQARRQLARVDHINLERDLLEDAATIAPGSVLRSLDAIHLASARSIGAALRAVVTYDVRMRDAALAIGLMVEAPS
jgi:predicted nucleic acid-binding protein